MLYQEASPYWVERAEAGFFFFFGAGFGVGFGADLATGAWTFGLAIFTGVMGVRSLHDVRTAQARVGRRNFCINLGV